MTWFKNCVLIDKLTREANCGANPCVSEINNPENVSNNRYKIICSSCCFIRKNDMKLLERLKSGFKRTIKWNKYRSQMTIQPQNNNLNYLIDLTFTNVNRLFVLTFPRNNAGDNRDSFFKLLSTKCQNKILMSELTGKVFLICQ